MGNLKELIALCEGHKIYIQTHNFPDPDAIASAFGLQKLLKHYGIGSELCYDGRIDKLSASKMLDTFGIRMQSYEKLRSTLREEDYIVCVDTQKHSGNVTDLDIQMFRFLFSYSDQEKLSDLERNNMEFNDLKAYGAAIESIELYDKAGFSCIPFSCPDALIAIISDFILALIEVEVAVVFSQRENEIKFSVRSEDPKVHAGNLIHEALAGIGSGGGHAAMAGGLIPKDQESLLGNYPKEFIRDLFLKVLEKK